jgi:hypothetical protein
MEKDPLFESEAVDKLVLIARGHDATLTKEQAQEALGRLSELSRLRPRIKEYEYALEKAKTGMIGAELEIDTVGRGIGDVMEEAWSRALRVDLDRVSFFFGTHKITIARR